MFPRQLSSLGSILPPHRLLPASALRAGFRSGAPWWWVQGGLPPRPARLRLPGHVFRSSAALDRGANRLGGNFLPGHCGAPPESLAPFLPGFRPRLFHRASFGGPMDRALEPPRKRRKSSSEGRKSAEDKGGGGGGLPGKAGAKAKEGGPKRERSRLDPSAVASPGLPDSSRSEQGRSKEPLGPGDKERSVSEQGRSKEPLGPGDKERSVSEQGRSKEPLGPGDKERSVSEQGRSKEPLGPGDKERSVSEQGRSKEPLGPGDKERSVSEQGRSKEPLGARDKERSVSEQGRSKEPLGPGDKERSVSKQGRSKEPLGPGDKERSVSEQGRSKEPLGPGDKERSVSEQGRSKEPLGPGDKERSVSEQGRSKEPLGAATQASETNPAWSHPSHHQQGVQTAASLLAPGPPAQPQHTPRTPNPWFRDGAQEQPLPPPGTFPPRRAGALQRAWETSSAFRAALLQPPPGDAPFDFSVLCYNILSQDLLHDNYYLYRHCHPGVLPWQSRLPNLLAEVAHYDADILCLQEVQEDHYEAQIKPALQAQGYHCEYKRRTGKKPDGCAVAFKSSRFSLLSSHPVEFCRPRLAPLLDRDNVGLVLLLRPAGPGGPSDPAPSLCVANTHLLFNPRRGDIKLTQLAVLLAEITRLSRLPDGTTNPVVLCGDFNSVPGSPLYDFLTTGRLEYQGLPIGAVSGQEATSRGQRVLTVPLWPSGLGINQRCQYEDPAADPPVSPTVIDLTSPDLTVIDLTSPSVEEAFDSRPRIEHSVSLRSVYQHRLPPDGRPEITTCHSLAAITVDYILYTPVSNPPPASLPAAGGRGLQPLGRLSLVGEPELVEVNGLPNRHHSSDHLPLLARFRLHS